MFELQLDKCPMGQYAENQTQVETEVNLEAGVTLWVDELTDTPFEYLYLHMNIQ